MNIDFLFSTDNIVSKNSNNHRMGVHISTDKADDDGMNIRDKMYTCTLPSGIVEKKCTYFMKYIVECDKWTENEQLNVEYILHKDPSVLNIKSKHGWTPIMIACLKIKQHGKSLVSLLATYPTIDLDFSSIAGTNTLNYIFDDDYFDNADVIPVEYKEIIKDAVSIIAKNSNFNYNESGLSQRATIGILEVINKTKSDIISEQENIKTKAEYRAMPGEGFTKQKKYEFVCRKFNIDMSRGDSNNSANNDSNNDSNNDANNDSNNDANNDSNNDANNDSNNDLQTVNFADNQIIPESVINDVIKNNLEEFTEFYTNVVIQEIKKAYKT